MNRQKTVLVLGSGATVGGKFVIRTSTGSNCTPPMDHNFFESPLVYTLFNNTDYPALYYYKNRLKEQSLETTWSKIDLILKLCLSKVIDESYAFNELHEKLHEKSYKDDNYRRKISNEVIRNCVPSMAGWEFISLIRCIYKNLEKPGKDESPLKTLIEKLQEENLLDSIITYNYDLSVESIFDEYFYPIPDCCTIFEPINKSESNTIIPLFKLHGSINWQEKSIDEKIREVKVGHISKMEHGDGCYIQPSIIPPTIFKQEINIDFQKDWRGVFYKKLWGNCWERVCKADNLIFVGCGLPYADIHARIFFESASRNKKLSLAFVEVERPRLALS